MLTHVHTRIHYVHKAMYVQKFMTCIMDDVTDEFLNLWPQDTLRHIMVKSSTESTSRESHFGTSRRLLNVAVIFRLLKIIPFLGA